MKKLFTLAMICFIAASMQAKIVYVTPDATATTVPTTPAWSSPITLATAMTNASVLTTDSIFIKAGSYTISPTAAAQPTSMIYLTSTKLILGGFAGTETNSAQRVKSDVDGNGAVEPWEYTNQTIFDGGGTLMVFYTSGANSLISGIVFQNGYAGFVSGGTTGNTYVTTANSVLYAADAAGLHVNAQNATILNCIIRNNTITTATYTGPTGASTTVPNNPGCSAGLTLKQAGTVNGCLIDGNIFDFVVSSGFTTNTVINALATAPTFTNTTGAGVYNGNGAIVKNSVIRNNISKGYKYTLQNTKTGEIALRGGGIYMNNAGSAFYNCVIANNEIQATDLLGADNIAGGGVFGDNGGGLFNCTVVNNKVSSAILATPGTYNNIGYGGGVFLKTASSWTASTNGPIVKIYNCAVWNNSAGGALDPNRANLALRNNVSSCMLEVENNVLPTNPYWYGNAINVTTQASNNVYAMYKNCVIDLSATNSGTNAPLFASPAAVVGYSSTATDIKANWSILTGSYLSGKATAPFLATDFNGTTFNYPTPAVGAYELAPAGGKTTPVITWTQAAISQAFAPNFSTGALPTVALATPTSSVSDGAALSFITTNNVVSLNGSVATINRGGTTTITAYQAATDKYNASAVVIPVTIAQCVTVPTITWTQDLTLLLTTISTVNAGATSTTDQFTLATNPISYTSGTTSIATVAGNVISTKGVGTATLTANQVANASFPAATPVNNTITIGMGTPVLNWVQDLSALKTTDTQVALTATSSVTDGAAITYSSSDITVVDIIGSNLMIKGIAGTATVTAVQPANAKYNATDPVSHQVTVLLATGINEYKTSNTLFVKVDKQLVSNVVGNVQIYSFSGLLVKSEKVMIGQKIALPSGAYFIKAITESGSFVQKIVL
jgi:hypothetical protein